MPRWHGGIVRECFMKMKSLFTPSLCLMEHVSDFLRGCLLLLLLVPRFTVARCRGGESLVMLTFRLIVVGVWNSCYFPDIVFFLAMMPVYFCFHRATPIAMSQHIMEIFLSSCLHADEYKGRAAKCCICFHYGHDYKHDQVPIFLCSFVNGFVFFVNHSFVNDIHIFI